MVRVKVCGITNKEDASMAVELGVDALGFIFAPSPRRVTPEYVRRIVDMLPPFVQAVGVFVDEDLKTIRHVVDYCGLSMVQLHGRESPQFCSKLMPYTVKAFRIQDESSLMPISSYRGRIRALVLDTYRKNVKGGTGRAFDWNLALKASELGMPIILSGGLNPSNIERAIMAVRPYAVDVNSGVEVRPGKKSFVRMSVFMEALRKIGSGGVVDGWWKRYIQNKPGEYCA